MFKQIISLKSYVKDNRNILNMNKQLLFSKNALYGPLNLVAMSSPHFDTILFTTLSQFLNIFF